MRESGAAIRADPVKSALADLEARTRTAFPHHCAPAFRDNGVRL